VVFGVAANRPRSRSVCAGRDNCGRRCDAHLAAAGHAIPQGQTASDFRTQTYHGRPVLTWWQGTRLGALSSGTDYIYNDHYQPIAAVNAGNGLGTDGHEFLITPWNTALILSCTTATANLSAIGGPANQTVSNGVAQEIDIASGKVLFQ
jgi:hypothetical protein